MGNVSHKLINGNSQLAGIWDRVIAANYRDLASFGNFSNLKTWVLIGRNTAVGTSALDITSSNNVYAWPQTASTLEVISLSGDDDVAGTGARKIKIVGLNASWEEIEEEVDTNGLLASTPTTNSFLRVNDAYVTESGTYSTSTAGGHAGNITIRNSGAGLSHGVIKVEDGMQLGYAHTGRFTVPKGWTAIPLNLSFTVLSGKVASIFVWVRPNSVDFSTIYAKRNVLPYNGIAGGSGLELNTGVTRSFGQYTDIWASAIATAADAEVQVRAAGILIKDL
jgi:hypothetical protein